MKLTIHTNYNKELNITAVNIESENQSSLNTLCLVKAEMDLNFRSLDFECASIIDALETHLDKLKRQGA